MSKQRNHLYEFGPFLLDPAERRLLRDRQPVPLAPKAFDLLLVLVQHSGHLLEKEELLRLVWPDQFVEEGNLSLNISVLRKTLGDDQAAHRYIETVPKKGYRFVAQITDPAAEPFPSVEARWFIRPPVLAIVVTLCCLVIGVGFLQHRPHTSRPTTIVVLPFDNLTGNSDRDFLATAATDQVITGIGSRSDLNVIDRATSAKLKRTEECIIRIGELLRADFVVQGSLVGPPQAPLITAGIYRVRDNTKLWAAQLPAGSDGGMSAYRLIVAKVGEIAD
jgi:DNA-binding winged helix-turn-helix (wHTH) protein/TolB-like protein